MFPRQIKYHELKFISLFDNLLLARDPRDTNWSNGGSNSVYIGLGKKLKRNDNEQNGRITKEKINKFKKKTNKQITMF